MKKSALAVGAILVVVVGFFVFKALKKSPSSNTPADNVKVELPLNVLPLEERPYLTLAPDATGRSLNFTLAGAPAAGELEYELIYQASGKQEGAIGTIFLGSEKQPLTKSILLGSKSGGGKVTYHEGVTGGSLTVIYGETRLKESWNFLKFNSQDPSFSSTDGKFSVTLTKTALKPDSMIVTMKSFGYPKLEGKVVSGPYFYATRAVVKGSISVSLKLPAGEHTNPMLYGFDGKTWSQLKSTVAGDTVTASATPAHTTFVVTAE